MGAIKGINYSINRKKFLLSVMTISICEIFNKDGSQVYYRNVNYKNNCKILEANVSLTPKILFENWDLI